jgi:steroid delta-isomerase-like uncharacterized protein
MSLLHENRRLWQKHVVAENRRSVDGLLETLSDEPLYTIMATGEEFRGREAVAEFYTGLFAGVPDAIFDLISVFVSEDGVMEESVLKGTQAGKLFGLPPTHKSFSLPLVIVFPIKNGEILGERLYFDIATLMHQLGIPLDQIPVT